MSDLADDAWGEGNADDMREFTTTESQPQGELRIPDDLKGDYQRACMQHKGHRGYVQGLIERIGRAEAALTLARARIDEVENALLVSEQYREAYADGKYKLYAMGEEICAAAAKHLPMSEGPLSRFTAEIKRRRAALAATKEPS